MTECIMSGESGATRTDVTHPALVTNAFHEECDVLYAMRKINHAHLLNAIAAFVRGEQCGFIMPRARGSLRTFWETQVRSTYGTEKISSWLFTQLLGITDGLVNLHGYRSEDKPWTRHGALTPDNMLWFPGDVSDPDTHSLGVLIIGDPGRTKELRKHTSGNYSAAFRYEARERPPSLSDDIWSLGLICFEFVIWLIRGNREVQNFRSQTSKVYFSDEDDYKFERWSNLLLNDDRCLLGTPLGELVRFIVRRLLVPCGQSVENRGRATASQFHSWVSSSVNTSGSLFTAEQPNIPGPNPPRLDPPRLAPPRPTPPRPTPPRPYERSRRRTSVSPDGDSASTHVAYWRANRAKFRNFNFSVPWRRRKGDEK